MDEKKAIVEHLSDLRSCIIRSLIGLFIAMIASYLAVDVLMALLKRPMLEKMPEGAKFVVLAPYEYFFTKLKAAFYFGLVLAAPWIFSQIWCFLAPGLYKNEKKFLASFVGAASLCFILGTVFAYYLVFPAMFEFFVRTLPPDIVATYSISMLFSFAITILISFGLIFQTPLAVFLLIIFNLVSAESFKKYRRHIFVLCFIVGALLTPPDPISQIMLAIPMYILFELGLGLATLFLTIREANPKIS